MILMTSCLNLLHSLMTSPPELHLAVIMVWYLLLTPATDDPIPPATAAADESIEINIPFDLEPTTVPCRHYLMSNVSQLLQEKDN